jgi:hypothetical protein
MILYNITVNIEPHIKNSWLDYVRNIYVPSVMATNLFVDHRIFKLLNDSSESGLTYSIQFYSNTLSEAEQYIGEHAQEITSLHNQRFRHQQVSFMTMLESLD